MPETTTAVELTADDLTAMKMAESVTFHVNAGLHDDPQDGVFIRVYTQAYGEPRIYTAKQQRLFTIHMYEGTRGREIGTTAHAFGYHGQGTTAWRWSSGSGWETGGEERTTPPACFHTMHDSDAWRTIVRSLKVGDRLHVSWTADNNNGYSRDAGLHVDQVQLKAIPARQPERGPQVSSTWNIGWTVCQDNSARMIRRYGN